jgi:hypothetical protein
MQMHFRAVRWLWPSALGVLILNAVGATPSGAQVSVDVIPFAGSFLPLSDWGEVQEQNTARPDRFRQQVGVLGGARLRFEISDATGFEFSGAYVNTGWTEEREGTVGPELARKIAYTLHGHMIMLDGRVLLRPRRSNLFGILGLGYNMRGGRAWDDALWSSVSQQPTVYNKNNIAGILGLGLRAAASPRIQTEVTAELRINAGDRVKQGFAFPNSTFKNKSPQMELVVTAGIPLRVTGR